MQKNMKNAKIKTSNEKGKVAPNNIIVSNGSKI